MLALMLDAQQSSVTRADVDEQTTAARSLLSWQLRSKVTPAAGELPARLGGTTPLGSLQKARFLRQLIVYIDPLSIPKPFLFALTISEASSYPLESVSSTFTEFARLARQSSKQAPPLHLLTQPPTTSNMSDTLTEFAEIPRDFIRDGTAFMNRCTKPDKREFIKISQAVGMGFLIMGVIGYLIKLSKWITYVLSLFSLLWFPFRRRGVTFTAIASFGQKGLGGTLGTLACGDIIRDVPVSSRHGSCLAFSSLCESYLDFGLTIFFFLPHSPHPSQQYSSRRTIVGAVSRKDARHVLEE